MEILIEKDFVANQWKQVSCLTMSSQMSDTFPEPCQDYNLIPSATLLLKLSSSPSLNKFNRLTEFQPDAPCWLSKGPRWDNIMVYKARMKHFRCLMGENSNLSHKWQFSMIPQSHTQKMWNSNKGTKQTHKRRLIPNATMLVWLLKSYQLLNQWSYWKIRFTNNNKKWFVIYCLSWQGVKRL